MCSFRSGEACALTAGLGSPFLPTEGGQLPEPAPLSSSPSASVLLGGRLLGLFCDLTSDVVHVQIPHLPDQVVEGAAGERPGL